MWEFPSVQEFIGSNGFQFVWTLFVLIFSGISWAYVYSSVRNNTKESRGEFVKNVVIGLVTFLLVIFSSCILVQRYNETSSCRNLDLNRVKGVQVKKIDSENSLATGSRVVTIDDEKLVQEGLKLLRGAPNRHRQKDKFINGYELQLILEDSRYSGFYIYYFSESQKYFSESKENRKADVIIPRCEGTAGVINSAQGTYSSTFFGDWIRENIEPKFKDR